MSRRSPRISETMQGNKHVIADYPRNLDRLASFNEECQKIQLAAGLAMGRSSSRETRFSNLIQEDMFFENQRNNKIIAKKPQHNKTESGHHHHLAKTQYTARNKGQKSAHKSSLSHNSATLIHQPPSISAETSLNKHQISEILGEMCNQNDDLRIKHIQRRAKAFVDQMFIERRVAGRQGASSNHKPFSDALEILSTNKDLFMEFLPAPNPTLSTFIMPGADAKFSECVSMYDTSSENGKLEKPFLENSRHKCQYSSNTHSKPDLDKIVILKPAPQKTRHSENVTCHCSSVHSYQKLGDKVHNPKPRSFSFKEIKRKLQHTFGGNKKGTKQVSAKGNRPTYSGPILGVGDCICRGTETVNSSNSSTKVETRGNISKKSPLISVNRPDNICMKETVRKKVDIPSVSLSKKQEFDVILEAKKQLRARAKDVNVLENTERKRSLKSLAHILSSPQHDLWPISPKRDSLYCSGSAQNSCSTCSNFPSIAQSGCLVMSERQKVYSGLLRPSKEVTSVDNYKTNEGKIQTLEANTNSSVTGSLDDHENRIILSETEEANFNSGEQRHEEVDNIQKHELCIREVGSEIASTAQTSDITELHEDDESSVHFVDSHLENETLASTLDDIPFIPLRRCYSTKDQEEHRSPVSVLEPFFTDDTNSPPSTISPAAEQSLRPRRLDFEECQFDSTHEDPQLGTKTCKNEQDPISVYVHLVLQASPTNWDHLSEISPLPEELIHGSLYEQVELPLIDPSLSPKILFDHINEVLLDIHQWHFSSPPSLTFIKPKIMNFPLEEVVIDEIMKEADFYLLPQREKRTLNQIVSKDIAKSSAWIDLRLDTEQVGIQMSEYFVEELILEVLLAFDT